MTEPASGTPGSRNARRERLVGLLVLGVAVVLLVSTPTWFASGQGGVAIAQLAVAVVLAAVGAFLVRRAGRG
ncbi:hypothetical protein QOZ88_00175 [Blastococcus sp. BMG 814]|uniref:MYXO-CTERM domain-containing protein n=1 Tax=Blastococcus carthaginiensis TaxID=3050034 RepID=A0ABT9I648_9ACTN|nr:hypothetical protein [Blastococcus carthaginiensis]MDP5181041.1 hypothetical protein [Blastococcus carthaginiensis]